VFECVSVCCSILQCVATQLQCVANIAFDLFSIFLFKPPLFLSCTIHCVRLRCSVLQPSCSVLQISPSMCSPSSLLLFQTTSFPAQSNKHLCCSVLQCVAVCCSVLQCVAVYNRGNDVKVGCTERFRLQKVSPYILYCAHNDTQYVAVRCSALQCVAVRCSALQCVAVCCSALQSVAVRCVCCSALQRVAVCYSVLQCVAVCSVALSHRPWEVVLYNVLYVYLCIVHT